MVQETGRQHDVQIIYWWNNKYGTMYDRGR